ncbi:JAB domain-containing protein [Phocaeicola vulgatus]|uniref:JAB domain-containing protein n=1 Tax=Phocaeicola vulgatus TaxID=821 RepID=A0A848QM98_PHOVU|nr:JAB domain-containing protein [Phocaeicola vulgatus]NMW39386.1 JAB domain-containing protein [Phocaeicola vulgatus]
MNSKILDIDYTVGEVELTYKSTSKSRSKIYSSEDAYKYLLPTYKEGAICYKEYFKVLFLNQSNQVLGYTLISEGGITDTTVDVRVILQAALLTNSVAIILAHNHPSGNLKPSRQDMEITKQVKDAARLMRITVTDHLILTDAGYYSFADEGLL